MAGATGIRARTFFFFAALGTAIKATIIFFVGDALAAPLEDFADFIARYQWYLTPITFAIVAVQLVRRRRKDQLPIESIDKVEEELEEIEEELERKEELLNPPSATQG